MAGGAVVTGSGLGANAPKNNFAGIAMVAFAAFAGILYGYDTGTIGGITAMKDWLRLFGEPTDDTDTHPTGYFIRSGRQSLVTSILSAGTFVGECSIGNEQKQRMIESHASLSTVLVFRRSHRWPSR